MLPLIAAILSIAAGLVVVTLLVLYWSDIVEWFRKRQSLKDSDKANIAFTLQTRIEDGNYETIRGIFNRNTNEILDGEKVISKNIDTELAQAHSKNELVLYE